MATHLDIWFCPRLAEVRPFIFRVASLMFALVFLSGGVWLVFWCGVGMFCVGLLFGEGVWVGVGVILCASLEF